MYMYMYVCMYFFSNQNNAQCTTQTPVGKPVLYFLLFLGCLHFTHILYYDFNR